MAPINRREFLRNAGYFVVSAAVIPKLGCGDGGSGGSPDAANPDAPILPGTYRFPQGVASGDPRSTSVVLWTRVEEVAATGAAVDLRVEVATDAAFTAIVVSQMVQATAASDHTVRVVVTSLTAATNLYYRFTAGADVAEGRTRTAPAKNADVPVHFAWVNCQDYYPGFYSAYRQLIADDEARPDAEKIQFVVHLGDFIYETLGQGFQTPLDARFQAITLTNPDSSPRTVPQFPSGSTDTPDTVADYRHLYKRYLSDPDVQAARARWPFIHIWDDHEFLNDCWQTMANYNDELSTDEPSQTKKIASNQAWFEFVPCQLTGAEGVTGVPNQAHDFTSATVTDAAFTAPNSDNFVPEPNNVAAVGSLTIFRSFRFGQHVELVMTDLRSYRSDHPIPEEVAFGQALFFDPRSVVPLELVNVLDEGETANGGSPPATVLGFPNARQTSPRGTMLGAAQKAWWKATMKGSDATWKVWGSEVMQMRCVINTAGLPILTWDRVLTSDTWDGYNSERKELFAYLRTEGIGNLVTITGDIHAHFAGLLLDDYDAATPNTVGVELVAAGISSNSLLSFFESRTRTGTGAVARQLVTFEDTPGGNFIENLNLTLLKGTVSGATYASTKDLPAALAAADPIVNTHMKYADTNAQGYGLLSVTATTVTGTLVTINRPTSATGTTGPGVKRTARFVIPKDNPAGTTGPEITGTKPLPFT